jgi:nicotinamidase-related amidase
MVKKILLWFFGILILLIGFFYINLKVYQKRSSIVSEGKPIEQYDSNKSALLVMDIQEYTTGEVSVNEVFKKAADVTIPVINSITEYADAHGTTVVYVRSIISNPVINLINNSLAEGNPGAELDRRLKIVSDHIVPKEKQDAFNNTILDSILINNEISRLVLVGLDAAHCVNSTIEGARNRGYDISVISDAILSDPDSVKYNMLESYASRDVKILTSEEYLQNDEAN